MGCAARTVGIVLFLCSILCILITRLAPKVVEAALEKGIKQQLVWSPDSPAEVDARYRNSSTGPPDLVRFYLLNVTNPTAVRNGSAKPNMVELGPYTYRVNRIKLDVWWNRVGEVMYKDWEYYVPQLDLTFGSLDDNVTVLNLPLIGVLETISASVDSPAARRYLALLARVLEQFHDSHVQGMFTTRTVRELLWGYEDTLLVTLKRWLPKQVDKTVFSLVKNTTDLQTALTKPYTIVDTGSSNISHLWNMKQVDGYRNVSSWNSCVEVVKGTDAQQFPPGLSERSEVWVWVGELYRAARMVVKDVVDLFGIRLLRFWPDPSQGDPDSCHCQTITGLMNVTSPTAGGPQGQSGQAGPPLFISMPHFCQADPLLLEGVVGLQCNESLHTTYVDVEPITGLTMRAFKRLMLSSQPSASALAIDPHIDPNVIIPMFWAEESSQLEQQQAENFKKSVYGTQRLIRHLGSWPYFAALALALLATFITIISILPRCRHPRKTPLPLTSEDTAPLAPPPPFYPNYALPAKYNTSLTELLLSPEDAASGYLAGGSHTGVPFQAVRADSLSEATTSASHKKGSHHAVHTSHMMSATSDGNDTQHAQCISRMVSTCSTASNVHEAHCISHKMSTCSVASNTHKAQCMSHAVSTHSMASSSHQAQSISHMYTAPSAMSSGSWQLLADGSGHEILADGVGENAPVSNTSSEHGVWSEHGGVATSASEHGPSSITSSEVAPMSDFSRDRGLAVTTPCKGAPSTKISSDNGICNGSGCLATEKGIATVLPDKGSQSEVRLPSDCSRCPAVTSLLDADRKNAAAAKAGSTWYFVPHPESLAERCSHSPTGIVHKLSEAGGVTDDTLSWGEGVTHDTLSLGDGAANAKLSQGDGATNAKLPWGDGAAHAHLSRGDGAANAEMSRGNGATDARSLQDGDCQASSPSKPPVQAPMQAAVQQLAWDQSTVMPKHSLQSPCLAASSDMDGRHHAVGTGGWDQHAGTTTAGADKAVAALRSRQTQSVPLQRLLTSHHIEFDL